MGFRFLLLSLAISVAAHAATPSAGTVEPTFTLTAWTTDAGLPPGDVLAITEDRDGYLWLGTTSGLVRFDGAVFTPRETRGGAMASASRAVAALLGARDGSLWIGHGGNGGIERIQANQVTAFDADSGLMSGAIAALIEDRSGAIWAGGRGGISVFRGGTWHRMTSGPGLADANVYSLYEDRSGRLWLGTAAGVYAGENGVFDLRYPDAKFVQDFAEDSHGTMWITDTRDTIKRVTTGEGPIHAANARAPQSGWRLAMDDNGRLWIAALGGGLVRLVDGDGTTQRRDDERGYHLERFAFEHKIAGAPRSVFADRDGNLWVGMRGGGLLRVSENSIRADVPLDGLTNDGVRAVRAAPDGALWVATGHSLNRFVRGARDVFPVAQVRAFDLDASGRLGVATARGFERFEGSRFVAVDPAADIQWEGIMAIAADATGMRWLCSSQQGVMTWDGTTVRRPTGVHDLSGSCSTIYADRQHRLWIGFAGGGAAMKHDAAWHRFDENSGLAAGSVLVILEDRSGAIWIATTSGLSRYQDGRFTTVTARNGPFADFVATLVEDDEGYLWAGVSSGAALVRFRPREMDRVAADPLHNVEYALYDASDGLRGPVPWQQSRSLGARAADGRLWFASGPTLTVIDPRELPRTQRPVAPRIESISFDGRQLSPMPNLELPPRVATTTIDWSAISLGAASKLRFRYRLEGYDRDWVPAGSRRSVSYPQLPSGRYRFRVSATNDGIWTDGPPWEFAVAPPFYLSAWFLSLCVVATLAAIAGAWWLRMQTVKQRYALVFAERALVSREIHDTLLQSLAAIGIELEAARRQLDPGQTATIEALRRLQHQAAHSLGEARDLVVALRKTGVAKAPSLVETLREIAAHTTATRGANASLVVTGTVKRCSGDVELQLLRICQEALNNALVHGRASEIAIVLDFQPDRMVLRITDNGCGFVVDAAAESTDGKEHLGLLGMRERGSRIGAELTITSAPASGTTIELVAPYDGR